LSDSDIRTEKVQISENFCPDIGSGYPGIFPDSSTLVPIFFFYFHFLQKQFYFQNLSRIRPASLLNDSIGLVTSSVQNSSNQQLMIPLQQQQSIPLNNNNFSQLDTNNSINVSERPNDPTLQKQQQHLILPQQQPSMVDGERAFAHRFFLNFFKHFLILIFLKCCCRFALSSRTCTYYGKSTNSTFVRKFKNYNC